MPVPTGTFNYWIAPWRWLPFDPTQRDLPDVNGGGLWQKPPGAVAGIDLRPLIAQEQSGESSAEGFGFFAIDPAAPDPPGGLLLADDLAKPLATATRREVESRLLLVGGELGEPSLLESGWRVVTDLADPSGSDRVKPLMPGATGNIEMVLASHSVVRSERFNRSDHAFVREVLRRDVQHQLRNVPPGRAAAFESRLLEKIRAKYGYSPGEITAPRGGASVSDDFNRSSSTDLGSNWTEVTGDHQVLDNSLRPTTNNNTLQGGDRSRFDGSDLAGADHKSAVSVITLTDRAADGSRVGAGVRFASTADTAYWFIVRNTGGGKESVYKIVNGTLTDIGTEGSFTVSLPHSVECEADGSTVRGRLDSNETQGVTDTSISGGTRAGIYAATRVSANEAIGDDWSAEDLGGGPAVRIRRNLLTSGVGR